MEVTLHAGSARVVIVIRVEEAAAQERPSPRVSWSERRFAESLENRTPIEAQPATPLRAAR